MPTDLPFETAFLTEGYQSVCQDKVRVLKTPESLVIAVADGAGGSGDGNNAATTVVNRVENFISKKRTINSWCDTLKRIDLEIGAGESTAVVVEVSENGIIGASVGDSRAWIIRNRQIVDLTANQRRKPLLGSGEGNPVGFCHGPLDGLLVVATDGFYNYVKRPELFNTVEGTGLSAMPKRFIDLVRLPSGKLWDDVGIVVCKKKRIPTRYSGRIELAFEDF